jgi:hypothetical protein
MRTDIKKIVTSPPRTHTLQGKKIGYTEIDSDTAVQGMIQRRALHVTLSTAEVHNTLLHQGSP